MLCGDLIILIVLARGILQKYSWLYNNIRGNLITNFVVAFFEKNNNYYTVIIIIISIFEFNTLIL